MQSNPDKYMKSPKMLVKIVELYQMKIYFLGFLGNIKQSCIFC